MQRSIAAAMAAIVLLAAPSTRALAIQDVNGKSTKAVQYAADKSTKAFGDVNEKSTRSIQDVSEKSTTAIQDINEKRKSRSHQSQGRPADKK